MKPAQVHVGSDRSHVQRCECTGRFWEGRFKTPVLPDEEAIAACMVNVDLNPVRASLAETPEDATSPACRTRIRSEVGGGVFR
ncbi:MAG: hypothetical protein R3C19_22555 [Planctomycetaceae bacterium]